MMDELAADAAAHATPFARRVARLFGLLGFEEVEDPGDLPRGALILEDRAGPLRRSYVVHCHDQAAPVGVEAVERLRRHLAHVRQALTPKATGILVASVAFAPEVELEAGTGQLDLLTISELEQSVIDFRGYVRDLIEELEGRESLRWYVEPRVRREGRQLQEPATVLLQEFLADPEVNHLTLLGDYGTGKTTLLRQTALALARRYESDVVGGGARGRVPVYIDLREYTQALSLKQIVLDLLDRHGVRAASYAAFEHLSREGQLVLILDGFDEMASRGNYEATLRNFRALNEEATGRAKVLLSCRTHYFTDHRDLQAFLGGGGAQRAGRLYTGLYREIASRSNFLLGYLQEFEEAQVEAYVRARCGPRAPALLRFIQETYNLEELARRPVLLDLIVSSAGDLEARGEEAVSPGQLYATYTGIWLARNDWSTVIDVHTKGRLLERFAARVAAEPGTALPHTELVELVRTWRPGLTEADLQEIDQELRTATFLVRDREGHYRFSHNSFLEFFFARHLLAEARAGSGAAWSEGFFSAEVFRFLRDLLTPQHPALGALLAWLGDAARPEGLRANVLKAVGAVQAPAVREALLALLASPGPEPLRHFAATALGHHPSPEVVAALRGAVLDAEAEDFVRSNALLALGRLDHPEARPFLVALLEGEEDLPSAQLWALARAARRSPELARACISFARRHLDDDDIVAAALELAEASPSAEAEAFCAEVLAATTRTKEAALALTRLSPEARRDALPRVLPLLRRDPSHPYAEALLSGLSGVGGPEVAAALVALAGAPQGPLALPALSLLVAEHPAELLARAPRWIGPGRHYAFRLAVARFYAERAPRAALPHLLAMLGRNQRVRVKLEVLGILRDHLPGDFAEVVAELWPEEPAPRVKRRALELLLQLDRDRAVALMLSEGVRAKRNGTRVAVCELLASVPEEAVTEALLERLRSDRSKWVRLHALRSLLTPGRGVAPERVVAASAGETDPEILAQRRSLTGR